MAGNSQGLKDIPILTEPPRHRQEKILTVSGHFGGERRTGPSPLPLGKMGLKLEKGDRGRRQAGAGCAW